MIKNGWKPARLQSKYNYFGCDVIVDVGLCFNSWHDWNLQKSKPFLIFGSFILQ